MVWEVISKNEHPFKSLPNHRNTPSNWSRESQVLSHFTSLTNLRHTRLPFQYIFRQKILDWETEHEITANRTFFLHFEAIICLWFLNSAKSSFVRYCNLRYKCSPSKIRADICVTVKDVSRTQRGLFQLAIGQIWTRTFISYHFTLHGKATSFGVNRNGIVDLNKTDESQKWSNDVLCTLTRFKVQTDKKSEWNDASRPSAVLQVHYWEHYKYVKVARSTTDHKCIMGNCSTCIRESQERKYPSHWRTDHRNV